MLPILHLNGYKIANPTVLARIPEERAGRALRGLRLPADRRRWRLRRRRPGGGAPAIAAALDDALDEIARIQQRARATAASSQRPRWPMIVLRTPKGWTGPKEVDGLPVEGTWRSHQVPLADVRENPEHLRLLEEWMRSYRPEELFDDERRDSCRSSRELAADGRAPDEREPARERRRCSCATSSCRTSATTRSTSPSPGTTFSEATRVLGEFLRDVIARNPDNFRLFGPDETASNRLGDVFEVTGASRGRRRREPTDEHLAPGRPRDGGALRAPVPGLARGLPAHRPARPLQLLRGVHPHRRLDVQPAREVAEGDARHPVAAPDRVAQLPAQLARLAPGPQRLLAPGSRASSTTS